MRTKRLIVAAWVLTGLFAIKRWWKRFTGWCPVCLSLTDDEHHGYNLTYPHCHNCGWCNMKGCAAK